MRLGREGYVRAGAEGYVRAGGEGYVRAGGEGCVKTEGFEGSRGGEGGCEGTSRRGCQPEPSGAFGAWCAVQGWGRTGAWSRTSCIMLIAISLSGFGTLVDSWRGTDVTVSGGVMVVAPTTSSTTARGRTNLAMTLRYAEVRIQVLSSIPATGRAADFITYVGSGITNLLFGIVIEDGKWIAYLGTNLFDMPIASPAADTWCALPSMLLPFLQQQKYFTYSFQHNLTEVSPKLGVWKILSRGGGGGASHLRS